MLALCFSLLCLSAAQQQLAEDDTNLRRLKDLVPDELAQAASSPFEGSLPGINSGTPYRKKTNIVDANDKSIATVAPAHPPVRATSSISSSSLKARLLDDWEVEDFTLLATLEGKVHAVDRITGATKWTMNYQGRELHAPMIETIHHNQDFYRFIVEPSQDGNLYIQHKDPSLGIQRVDFTVKALAESTPQLSDEPPLVYTARQDSALYTIDADTGNVIKIFGVGGSDANQRAFNTSDETDHQCRRTFQLGRVYYIVTIHDDRTNKELCTIKFSEWIPNRRDLDLQNQYSTTKVKNHIYSLHDGRIIRVDYSQNSFGETKFTRVLASPVARVFDVVRPMNPVDDTVPLILLSQPMAPPEALKDASQSDAWDERTSRIFVNCTENGDWYAFSESFFPMVTSQAPWARISRDNTFADFEQKFSEDEDEQEEHDEVNPYTGIQSIKPIEDGYNLPTLPGPAPGSALDMQSEFGLLPTRGPMHGATVSALSSSAVIWASIVLASLAFAFITYFVSPAESLRAVKSALRYFEQNRRADWSQPPFIRVSALPDTPPENDASRDINFDPLQQNLNGVQSKALGIVNRGNPTPPNSEPEIIESLGQTIIHEVTTEQHPPRNQDDLAEEDSGDEEADGDEVGEKLTKKKTNERSPENGIGDKPLKKTKRGRRGGKKHKKGKKSELAGEDQNTEAVHPVSESNLQDTPATVASFATESSEKVVDELRLGNDRWQIGSVTVDMAREKILGEGSNGTVVFPGELHGRQVAVKRLIRSSSINLANREIQLLLRSDNNENVVRYFGKETSAHFMWIALELFTASLDQFVEHPGNYPTLIPPAGIDPVDCVTQITRGVQHLHGLKLVHRDLKPQNILVKPRDNLRLNGRTPTLRYVISDFGLCKQLDENNPHSTFAPTANHTAAGTTGWRAPELLVDSRATVATPPACTKDIQHTASIGSTGSFDGSAVDPTSGRRVTKAIDVFSLGCIFYYVMTRGKHPYDFGGEHLARDLNIKNDKKDLGYLKMFDYSYEAEDLILQMLQHEPGHRISTFDILIHPYFWSTDSKLQFLCDVSDYMEHEKTRPEGSSDLDALQSLAPDVIPKNDFLTALPRKFKDSLGKQRSYTGSRMLDLLRALRNKKNHFNDLDPEIKVMIEALPGGYWQFWAERFPSLLVCCHCLVIERGLAEKSGVFRKYFD